MHELWSLFLTFARVGACTFGGGYAMLPILQLDVVEKKGYCTDEELTDMYAIGQCTPGVIAVNTATYIGSRQRGAVGALFSTLGVITPSIIIILLIASFLHPFMQEPVVQHAFAGVRIAVCALVTKTIYTMLKKNVRDAATAVIFVLTFCSIALLHLSPVIAVLLSAAAGLLLHGGETEDHK